MKVAQKSFLRRWHLCHFLTIGGTNVMFLGIGGTYVALIEGGTNVGGTNVGGTNVGGTNVCGRKVASSIKMP
jgi:hypothetical protein